jgi:hypothetical protein
MEIINLTPHDITIYDSTGTRILAIVPVGRPMARVASRAEIVDSIDGVPVVETVWGDVVDLPERREGVVCAVSALTLQAAQRQGRTDCISPDTGPESVVRDGAGRIIGVRRWTR